MNTLEFIAMSSAAYEAYRAGRHDDNGQPPERLRSDGSGWPCRHCLSDIAADQDALLLGWRPFTAPQPYAETGPVFLHAAPCQRHDDNSIDLPAVLKVRPQVLVRGYDAHQRIVGGSGSMQAMATLVTHCESLLADPRIEFLHLRSSSNSCYLCRVQRRGSH